MMALTHDASQKVLDQHFFGWLSKAFVPRFTCTFCVAFEKKRNVVKLFERFFVFVFAIITSIVAVRRSPKNMRFVVSFMFQLRFVMIVKYQIYANQPLWSKVASWGEDDETKLKTFCFAPSHPPPPQKLKKVKVWIWA